MGYWARAWLVSRLSCPVVLNSFDAENAGSQCSAICLGRYQLENDLKYFIMNNSSVFDFFGRAIWG